MVLELDEQAATPSKRTGSRTMEKEGRRRIWGMEERGKKKKKDMGNGREGKKKDMGDGK